MAFLGSLFDDGKGAGFQAKAADITNATSPQQLAQAQGQTQSGLSQQQSFLNALQGQNGIANQSSVFNQMQDVASGKGPNPAQTQLANATGQNVSNQAALMGSQRGASQNAGLMARQAANQGANIQQQAAGQAANMQANQSLNALNQMGGIAGQQVGQQGQALQNYNQFAQQNQAAQMNAQNAFNQNNVSMQSNMNNANAGIAAQNQKSQSDFFGGLMSGVGQGLQAAVGMSDERQKTNVHNASGQVQQFLDKTGAHEYEYKNPSLPGASPGKHISPMAQELEQSDLGSQLVQESPNGKMVDYAKAAPVMMAALSQINERLKSLEGPKKMAEGGEVSSEGAKPEEKNPFASPANASAMQQGASDMFGGIFGGGMNKLKGAMPNHAVNGAPGSGGGLPSAPGGMPGAPAAPGGAAAAGGPGLGGAGMSAQLGAMASSLGPAAMALSDKGQKKNIGPASPIKMAGGGVAPAAPMPMSGYDAYMAKRAQAENMGAPPTSPRPYGSVPPAGVPGRNMPMDMNQANPQVTPQYAAQQQELLRQEVARSRDLEAAGVAGRRERQKHAEEQLYGVAPQFAKGGQAKSYVGSRLQSGGKVPGKATHQGDNYKNDTVKALLSPGEIVIPRSIATGRNAPAKAAKFVESILAKQGLKSQSPKNRKS